MYLNTVCLKRSSSYVSNGYMYVHASVKYLHVVTIYSDGNFISRIYLRHEIIVSDKTFDLLC